MKLNKLRVFLWWLLPWPYSLEPRLFVPDFVSQLWRKIDKIRNRKPGFEATGHSPFLFIEDITLPNGERKSWVVIYALVHCTEADVKGLSSAFFEEKLAKLAWLALVGIANVRILYQ